MRQNAMAVDPRGPGDQIETSREPVGRLPALARRVEPDGAATDVARSHERIADPGRAKRRLTETPGRRNPARPVLIPATQVTA
jgi:hypothetical protein